MLVDVETKSGKQILTTFEAETVQDVIKEISRKRRINQNRIRLTDGTKVLTATDKISTKDKLIFKDLGFQVSWRGVFLIEYFGPMAIHALFALLPGIWYSKNIILPHLSQKIAFGMILLHYMKREIETIFVHRFSNGTMPWTNLPKNCFHYWILGGLAVAYPIYDPSFKASELSPELLYGIIALWIFSEISNLKTHMILRDLRPEGSTVRKVPIGYGFNLVACPNYFFEILGWIAFSVITGSWTSWFFTIVGGVQMYFWALKKHLRYKKEFGKEYPKRKILIPFLL